MAPRLNGLTVSVEPRRPNAIIDWDVFNDVAPAGHQADALGGD